jgi:hypothetical protein
VLPPPAVLRFQSDAPARTSPLLVAVPCLELPRPSVSPAAGNVQRVEQGKRYRLTLEGPPGGGPWGRQTAWRNVAIHDG